MTNTGLLKNASDRLSPSSSELRGLTAEEQFAATLHATLERFQAEGLLPGTQAYFLLSAARTALEQSETFSADQSLAGEYVYSALHLLAGARHGAP